MPFHRDLQPMIQNAAACGLHEFEMRNGLLKYLCPRTIQLAYDVIGNGPGVHCGNACCGVSKIVSSLNDPLCEPLCEMVLADAGAEPVIDKIWAHCRLSNPSAPDESQPVTIDGGIIHVFQDKFRWEDFEATTRLIGTALARRYWDYQADDEFTNAYLAAASVPPDQCRDHFAENLLLRLITPRGFLSRIWPSNAPQRSWQSLIQKELDRLRDRWRQRDLGNGD